MRDRVLSDVLDNGIFTPDLEDEQAWDQYARHFVKMGPTERKQVLHHINSEHLYKLTVTRECASAVQRMRELRNVDLQLRRSGR